MRERERLILFGNSGMFRKSLNSSQLISLRLDQTGLWHVRKCYLNVQVEYQKSKIPVGDLCVSSSSVVSSKSKIIISRRKLCGVCVCFYYFL